MFLNNVIKFENEVNIYKNNNINNSNFVYSGYDNNLLSDTRLDIIINLDICSNSNVEILYFYSNLDFSFDACNNLSVNSIVYKK
jgi:hypothetical protein